MSLVLGSRPDIGTGIGSRPFVDADLKAVVWFCLLGLVLSLVVFSPSAGLSP